MKYIYIILFFIIACNNDVIDVKLHGTVTENGIPVENFQLYIKNYYYEGGDYDSYMPAEKYTLTTNEDGYYKIFFNRSTYIQIDTVSEGYSDFFKDKNVRNKEIRLDFELD